MDNTKKLAELVEAFEFFEKAEAVTFKTPDLHVVIEESCRVNHSNFAVLMATGRSALATWALQQNFKELILQNLALLIKEEYKKGITLEERIKRISELQVGNGNSK